MSQSEWGIKWVLLIALLFGLFTAQEGRAAARKRIRIRTQAMPGSLRTLEDGYFEEEERKFRLKLQLIKTGQSDRKKPIEEIFSYITFPKKGRPIIHYADVSIPDPLDHCPVDDSPKDLKILIANLVKETTAATQQVKTAMGENCSSLNARMTASQADFAAAVTNQFALNAKISSAALVDQWTINAATQRATAVSHLFQTTTEMLQTGCFESTNQKVVIQRLIGQIVTFGGLFAGGWPGIATAAGGQLIGNFPLFHSSVDEAISAIRQDETRRAKIAYLCLYRQIAKTSCMLFTPPDARYVGGLDLEFRQGPARLTLENVAKMEKDAPALLKDFKLLRVIKLTGSKILPELTQEVVKNGSFAVFDKIKLWCAEAKVPAGFNSFSGTHPKEVEIGLRKIQHVCKNLEEFNYPKSVREGYAPTLAKFRDSLSRVIDYYNAVLKGEELEAQEFMAKTWESYEFMNQLRDSILQFKESHKGNQSRIDFMDFTRNLGDTLAVNSFQEIMKSSSTALNFRYYTSRRYRPGEIVHSSGTRSNALLAMLKACKTLDPTLVCLNVEPAETSFLQREWVRQCVGPKSTLCKNITEVERSELLLHDPEFILYFDSLCWVGHGVGGKRELDPGLPENESEKSEILLEPYQDL